ncbi:MAG: hypothetical protein HY831_03620 [Candidatus Aenigmarchaeota archaeon]|nr:hypothetical protein [Candidatus Aenigmarchaeota archaeon]
MVKFTKVLVVSILGIAMALGLALAQTDTATVDASVATSTLVDVSPNSFTWSSSSVGTIDPNYASAEIENIGSTNVSKLSIDVPGSYGAGYSPVGTGGVGGTTGGAYLLASTDNVTFSYIQNALGTNEIMPVYEVVGTVAAKGRFRFANYEYFWSVTTGNNTGGTTCGNGTLKYFNTTANAHNRTQVGGTALSSQSAITLAANANISTTPSTDLWGFTDVSFNTPAQFGGSYCFAIRSDCQIARLWKWNNNQGGGAVATDIYDNASLCARDAYFFSDATNGGTFYPGSLTRLYLTESIPSGTANGSLTQATLTVRATD